MEELTKKKDKIKEEGGCDFSYCTKEEDQNNVEDSREKPSPQHRGLLPLGQLQTMLTLTSVVYAFEPSLMKAPAWSGGPVECACGSKMSVFHMYRCQRERVVVSFCCV